MLYHREFYNRSTYFYQKSIVGFSWSPHEMVQLRPLGAQELRAYVFLFVEVIFLHGWFDDV